ncbi:DUF2971 domain-containing protein [Chromobacterium amazonense]|uniref:DUF2971 domain-containing protein n=1 Tax=Chromobacterium amazonense TaxID=1382803 RepID=UPI0009F2240C|nr:DUF2971 domain-containing protein [Chromobacterium amazonense]
MSTRHIYRFRSIENLLGENEELNKQEIYFAAPNQLNDPMEGMKDIFWQGDAIAWKNFFRHYVACLSNAYMEYAISGEEHFKKWRCISIKNPFFPNEESKLQELQNSIWSKFYSNQNIQEYIKTISGQNFKSRINQVLRHINTIHHLASITIVEEHSIRGFRAPVKIDPDVKENINKQIISEINRCQDIYSITEKDSNLEAIIERVYLTGKLFYDGLKIATIHNSKSEIYQENLEFIKTHFPEAYLYELEKLIYPDWYTACFMRDCNNSSVWGSYGKNHTGVCLKFKVEKEKDGKLSIKLKRKHPHDKLPRIEKLTFHPVNYNAKHISIDFFRTLGNITHQAQAHWFLDEDGKRSTCAESNFSSEEQRLKYWDNFYKAITVKTKDWRFEKEHRLLLNSMVSDLSDKQYRLATYDLSSLDGIIFGIKTDIQEKLKIIEIIKNKCITEGRKSFTFYQAFYNPQSGKIEHEEILKIQF